MSNPTYNHSIRGRFHVWFLSSIEGVMERIHGNRKRDLFSDLRGVIVELGPGTGVNCRYYLENSSVIGIEPNLRMHKFLYENARRSHINLEIRGIKAENLDLASRSVDFVVCTLVLCSVEDPSDVLSEVLRVLKPGGRFIFIEHVAAKRNTVLRWIQNIVQVPWSWCFEGCRPNRETTLMLKNAGFSRVDIDAFRVRSAFFHLAPHIAGVAVK